MRQDYEKLFTHLSTPEPPDGLLDKIIQRIARETKLIGIRRRIAIFSIGLAGSLAAFIPTIKIVRAGFSESGFFDFLSLLFSDAGAVMGYWQNFVLSLLEALPVTSFMALLAIVFVFLGSLKFLAKNAKTFFATKQLLNN